jgi:hypothetical protein
MSYKCMYAKPLNTEFWRRQGDHRGGCLPQDHSGKGLLWFVECKLCGVETLRTTREINNDVNRCPCRSKATHLSYEGESKTISEWVKLYPSLNYRAVQNRAAWRRQGKSGYSNITDAQVLFGLKHNRPEFGTRK